MSEPILLDGIVENIIYKNSDNGYTVFSLLIEDETSYLITCVAHLPDLNEGEALKLTGNYVTHPSYGKQFNVTSFEKNIPTTEKGIEKFLASGAIRGIGAKLAKKIIKKFGKNTLIIIEEYPERLSEIKGITPEKAMSISAVFHEQAELRQAMIFLQSFGISPIFAMKIYKKYKVNTEEVVKTNPYALADDIYGIGFKISDSIAFRIGIEANSPYRIKAGIKYCLNQGTSNGHVFLPKGLLLSHASELLGVSNELIENSFKELQIEGAIYQEIVEDVHCIYLNPYFYAENYVAKKLVELSTFTKDISKNININYELESLESANGLTLAKNQREAVIESLTNGVLVITGGPGTGKTTTVNSIISLLQKEKYEIELAAPTGRAAKRLSETTAMEAKTIHRLLEINYLAEDSRRQTFERNDENPLDADVVIIDESSMIDVLLMSSLLKAVTPGTRLILVGDVDQLPSVGPGSVLRDIIKSACIKVVRLNEIFRQAQQSAIVMNAHRINNGKYPILNEKNKDFFFVKRTTIEDVTNEILQLVLKRLPNYLNCNPVSDIQILTPMRKSPLGVNSLNQILQKHLNPENPNKNEKELRTSVLREGDKVMQIKNNYNLTWTSYEINGKISAEGVGVFNGDVGFITKINDNSQYVRVLFDDNRTVDYDFSQLDELELSYAVTVHKSQGSEYKAVILPIHSGSNLLMSKNLLYTAVTRAKTLVVIVGIAETLNRMVDNDREINRYTCLSFRIKKMKKYF